MMHKSVPIDPSKVTLELAQRGTDTKKAFPGAVELPSHRRLFTWSLMAFIGPGMIVSLADTDAACIIVAADSGAQFGYSSIVLLQILLVPVLFHAQAASSCSPVYVGRCGASEGRWETTDLCLCRS